MIVIASPCISDYSTSRVRIVFVNLHTKHTMLPKFPCPFFSSLALVLLYISQKGMAAFPGASHFVPYIASYNKHNHCSCFVERDALRELYDFRVTTTREARRNSWAVILRTVL